MKPFATLPFADQLAQIHALVASEQDVIPMLRDAGALPDPEPLAQLLVSLGRSNRLDEPVRAELTRIFEQLPDAGLQHLLAHAPTNEAVDATLRALALEALQRWPVQRLSALSLLHRWLRRRDPSAVRRFSEGVSTNTSQGSTQARELLFMSGQALFELGHEPALRALIHQTTHEALDALARAPKSISQANAEALLARRVYADPGHFFFELLQNADDAGATSWRAEVGNRAVTIQHDGSPFSFQDVVGVLSIGQTTKRAEQIGFFGVGFKSVYEICERPRIHSGVFDFEIAHVSIPRPLATRAREDARTVVELPYSTDVDVDQLYEKARAIPPETLLTLPNVREMRVVRDTQPDWSWSEQWRDDVATLVTDQDSPAQHYLCSKRHFSFPGAREDGRAKTSPILVAVSLDEEGNPVPLAGPTVYSFLPTAERTGLRCLVHARFDVTLDRERLEHDSPWNQALLKEAGLALADIVKRLAQRERSALPVLSALSELAPIGQPVAQAAAQELRTHPCLPNATGALIRPVNARVVDSALCLSLAGVDLGGQTQALAPLSPREREVALSLGASAFHDEDLVAFASASLHEGSTPPSWLDNAVLDALGNARVPDDDVCALPLLQDGGGKLARPDRAAVASASLAQLYAGLRPVLEARSIDLLPTALRERLAIKTFDSTTVAADLSTPRLADALLAREDTLLRALTGFTDSELSQLDALPVLRTGGGERCAIAAGLHRLDPDLGALRPHLHAVVPLLAEDTAARFAQLVERWVPEFGWAQLAQQLPRWLRDSAWTESASDAVVNLLDRAAGSIGHDLLTRFASTALFLDTHGRRRSLRGAQRALIASDPKLTGIIARWPWLAFPDRPSVQAANISTVGPAAVVDALVDNALPAHGAHALGEQDGTKVLDWLAKHARHLPNTRIDRLRAAPVWPDVTGKMRALSTLRKGGGSESIELLFEAIGSRFEASETSLRLAQAIRAEDDIASCDVNTVVEELVAHAAPVDIPRTTLAEILAQATTALPRATLRSVLAVPLFFDERGVAREIASWNDPTPHACHRPGALRSALTHTELPLLEAVEEEHFGGFLDAVGIEPATVSDLVRGIHAGLETVSASRELWQLLVEHSEDLDDEARAVLHELAIFENRLGQLGKITELYNIDDLHAFLSEDETCALNLDHVLLAPTQQATLGRLGLCAAPIGALLSHQLLPQLRAEHPLDGQPAPWNTPAALVRLLQLSQHAGVDPCSAPLAVDRNGLLVHGPLADASQATRRLIAAMPLARTLASKDWCDLIAADDRPAVLRTLSVREVTTALRAACPRELSITGHPTITDLPALYAWLAENRAPLGEDDDALAALGAAAVIPSQEGTLRAPRDLVLDPTIPELGLGWGVAPEVPSDVANWLARTFELDRRQRRTLVSHLLDGIDQAAEANDEARARELIAFLARSLGAGVVGDAELADRVRYNKVRARIRVPTTSHGWEKPKRAWLARASEAADVAAFCTRPPPQIALQAHDPHIDALLVACGAAAELDDETVQRCLAGELLRPGGTARIARSRYIAHRVVRAPQLRQRWQLDSVPWVVSRGGELARPSTLLWSDELARSLFGPRSSRLAADEIVADLDDEAGKTLGFQYASKLSLTEAAEFAGQREATPALLTWLELGLQQKRFRATEVRGAFRERLLLRDDEGVLRACAELAVHGARALFGPHRGDYTDAEHCPGLVRALGIPQTPDAAMVLSFLTSVSERLPENHDDLSEVIPRCFEALSVEAERGVDIQLPRGLLIAGLHRGSVVIARLTDDRVRMFEPVGIAEVLPTDMPNPWIELLPLAAPGSALAKLWLAAGVRDLWCDFVIDQVIPGPEQPAMVELGQALHEGLFATLGARVGQAVHVVEPLSVVGALKDAPRSATYRDAEPSLTAEVDAVLYHDQLWLTPACIDRPELLAPALERDPARRVALMRWLAERKWGALPKRLRTKKPAAKANHPGHKLLHRVRNLLTRRRSPEEPAAPRTPPASSHNKDTASVDEGLFQPRREIKSQLDGADEWLARRTKQPDFGFAFTPERLPAPWLYAPKLVSSEFEHFGQSWRAARIQPPGATVPDGAVSFRGRLPRGDAVLPIPMFGTVEQLLVDGEPVIFARGPCGEHLVRIGAPADVRIRVALGRVPNLNAAKSKQLKHATRPFVPDAELPTEVLDFVDTLDASTPAISRALLIRDFIRENYRYDPSYLEDSSVARWLRRVTQGRGNAHIAALHAARDSKHLGAGVCYELNTLACELLRRAGISAAIATGWVLDGGALSEPDHLWCIALLEDANGKPLWIPVDASTTRDGRPLRVPRRPRGRFRAPKDSKAKAPRPPKWDLGPSNRRKSTSRRSAKPKSQLPKAELLRVLHHLEHIAKHKPSNTLRKRLLRALEDPAKARALLAQITGTKAD